MWCRFPSSTLSLSRLRTAGLLPPTRGFNQYDLVLFPRIPTQSIRCQFNTTTSGLTSMFSSRESKLVTLLCTSLIVAVGLYKGGYIRFGLPTKARKMIIIGQQYVDKASDESLSKDEIIQCWKEAIYHFKEALSITENVVGNDDHRVLEPLLLYASAVFNLACVIDPNSGLLKMDLAVTLYHRALHLSGRWYTIDSEECGTILDRLGTVHSKQAVSLWAEEAYKAAAVTFVNVALRNGEGSLLGVNDNQYDIISNAVKRHQAHLEVKNQNKAKLFLDDIPRRKYVFGQTSTQLVGAMYNLAVFYATDCRDIENRMEKATTLLLKCIDIANRVNLLKSTHMCVGINHKKMESINDLLVKIKEEYITSVQPES